MTCLLCHQHLDHSAIFSDILFSLKNKQSTCQICRDKFELIDPTNHCPTCFRPNTSNQCQDCQYWENKGVQVNHQALYSYNSAMKEYISRYKFQGDYRLREVFAMELKNALKIYQDYTIVPVPLSAKSYQERQFNQVTGLLDAANTAYQDILDKKHGKKQSSKNRQERLKSSHQFHLKDGQKLPEKVLLVDDIYTTGSTLAQIKQLLLDDGVKNVKTFSLSR